MAIAAKKAPAKAAAKTAKPAPAVKDVDSEEGGVELQEGQEVRFLGYGEDTPEDQHILTEGEVYTIIGFIEPDGDDPGGDPIVRAPNQSFNPKKKEHPETNAKTIDVQVFADEVEPVEGPEEEGEEEPEEEETEEEEAPPPAPAKKGKAKAEVKTPAKAAAKKAPAKAKGKTKVAAKKVPAKAKGKAKASKEEAEEVDSDAVPELENEDADVLAIVEGSEDLIASAQDLDDQVAQNEYTIGGLLYHIKKDKLHHEILGDDGQPLYAGKGGWATFLVDHFKMEYRKAQWLLEVYVHFTLAGIPNPAEVVARIGYTKAKTIAKELTKDDANVDDLIELAESNSAADLSVAIKESEHVGGTKGEKKARITLRLRYYEAEAKSIEAILKTAAEQYGLKDIAEAMLQIATEWAAEHGGGVAEVEDAPKQRAATNGNGKAAPTKAVTTAKASAKVVPMKKVAAKRATAEV